MTGSQIKSASGVIAGYLAAVAVVLVPVLYATHHADAAKIVAGVAAALGGGGVTAAGWSQSLSQSHVSLPVETAAALGVDVEKHGGGV